MSREFEVRGSEFEESTSNIEPRTSNPAFTDEMRALLDIPRVGMLGTTNPDGTPLLTPVWYARDGDELWLVIEPDSPKTRNIRRDPRVMFVVMDESGYTYVAIQGRARLLSGEEGTKPREMAIRYLGEVGGARFAERDYIRREIVCRIAPETVWLRRAEGKRRRRYRGT